MSEIHSATEVGGVLRQCAVIHDSVCSAAGELRFPEQPPPCHQGHVSERRGWRAHPAGAAE